MLLSGPQFTFAKEAVQTKHEENTEHNGLQLLTNPPWRSRQRVRLLTYRSLVRIQREELFKSQNEVENLLKLLKILRSPGIEPGPPAWQARILPLDQLRLFT